MAEVFNLVLEWQNFAKSGHTSREEEKMMMHQKIISTFKML